MQGYAEVSPKNEVSEKQPPARKVEEKPTPKPDAKPENQEKKVTPPEPPRRDKVLPSSSGLSISGWMQKEKPVEQKQEKPKEQKPSDAFTEGQIQEYWTAFLQQLREKDPVRKAAIGGARLQKGESPNELIVRVPSQVVREEFGNLKRDFLSGLEKKINNFYIDITYVEDETLHKEIITKRKLFDKFAQINPILRDLDELMNFDLT